MLKDLTSLGLARVRICGTELGEKSYLESKLWREDQIRPFLIDGAEQGGTAFLPGIERYDELEAALDALDDGPKTRFVAHADAAAMSLIDVAATLDRNDSVLIAVGAERGFSESELSRFDDHGFRMVGLGDRILRTENAAFLACGILASYCRNRPDEP